MKNAKESLIKSDTTAFAEEERLKFNNRYDKLAEEGYAANPLPDQNENSRERRKEGKFHALLNRLVKYK